MLKERLPVKYFWILSLMFIRHLIEVTQIIFLMAESSVLIFYLQNQEEKNLVKLREFSKIILEDVS